MPPNFSWRKGQREAIQQIIEAYYDKDYHTVILDAPVGSGKSLIAMCASWILNQMGHDGYILSSDISLQDQYEKDLNKFRMSWGSVKGLDNYVCTDNLEKTPLGTCKIQGKDPKKFPCYIDCPYYSARAKASNSQTAMLNYAYWLVMMNDVNPKMDEPLFPPRDFTFCDEGHKILDIIQNSYSPKISQKIAEKIERLAEFFEVHKMGNYHEDVSTIKIAIHEMKDEEDQNKLLGLIARIALSIDNFKEPISIFRKSVKEKYPKKPPKEWRKSLWASDWLMSFQDKLVAYVKILQNTDIRNLIKNPNGDQIVFNCLEERYLMHKYFHKHTGFTVLMSATFSDPSSYLKSISLNGAKYIRLESQFNFDKSPIYFYNRRKMSYNYIEQNLPWLQQKVNEIINNHEGESGLIHSASYKLSMDIFNGLSPENRKRVLIYNGTEEKRHFLEDLKLNTDKILLGPSLLEGLDMKDNFGRFQIFAKVPYPNLMDRLVKAKMDLDPMWYSFKTSISILQGIGRIVRNENDWGVTYFLDASLSDLIHKNRKLFPLDFYQRIQAISE